MARFYPSDASYMNRSPYDYDFDSRGYHDYSIVAPVRGYDHDLDYDRVSNRGALVRGSQTIDEPLVEHEHHHLHHHIDHGNVNSQLVHRPRLGREYSYDDLDVRDRRYTNGTTVSHIHASHDHRHRHRYRHRSGRHQRIGSIERREYRRSREFGDHDLGEDVTVVDVPPGTKRVIIERERRGDYRDFEIDWRKDHGIRRSRGLGNELWTEITKDLVTREAIEELGYPYEETDFFYYIFEYLDRQEIAELRWISDEIRRDRARELEYRSVAGSVTPRMIASGRDPIIDETRTEIIIENGGRRRRNKYYY